MKMRRPHHGRGTVENVPEEKVIEWFWSFKQLKRAEMELIKFNASINKMAYWLLFSLQFCLINNSWILCGNFLVWDKSCVGEWCVWEMVVVCKWPSIKLLNIIKNRRATHFRMFLSFTWINNCGTSREKKMEWQVKWCRAFLSYFLWMKLIQA